MSQSSSHPYQVDPAAAAALLEQANRSTAAAQGNAGWPYAVFLVGIGAVSPSHGAQHPRHDLVDEFMHPVRFSLMAALAGVTALDFPTLKDQLDVSDSVLSRQASALESAGHLSVKKGYVGKRPRTWFALTDSGHQAWQGHLSALRAIVSE